MTIFYSDRPVGFGGSTPRLPGEIIDIDGDQVVQLPDGSILSVQPNGTFETRPPGTHGEYERVTFGTLNVLNFAPQGIPYAVFYSGV